MVFGFGSGKPEGESEEGSVAYNKEDSEYSTQGNEAQGYGAAKKYGQQADDETESSSPSKVSEGYGAAKKYGRQQEDSDYNAPSTESEGYGAAKKYSRQQEDSEYSEDTEGYGATKKYGRQELKSEDGEPIEGYGAYGSANKYGRQQEGSKDSKNSEGYGSSKKYGGRLGDSDDSEESVGYGTAKKPAKKYGRQQEDWEERLESEESEGYGSTKKHGGAQEDSEYSSGGADPFHSISQKVSNLAGAFGEKANLDDPDERTQFKKGGAGYGQSAYGAGSQDNEDSEYGNKSGRAGYASSERVSDEVEGYGRNDEESDRPKLSFQNRQQTNDAYNQSEY